MNTMDTKQKDYLLTIICYVVWGFQPLYYAIKPDTDAMFLLMSRILWAGVFVTSIVLVQGRGKEIIATFKKKDLMLKHIVPGAIFNFLDWGVYMWAVMNGHILATSMAYYIAPLAVCYFGVIFFKEKMTWQMGVATAIIVAGVLFAGDGFGNSPLITIILMFCFAAYAAFMKGVKEDSPLCTSVMMILAAPAAIIYIAIFRMGENGMASVDLGIQFFLIGAGIVTVLPILIYASCVKRLPMTSAVILWVRRWGKTNISCLALSGQECFSTASLQQFARKKKIAPPCRKRDSTSKTSRIAKIINRIPERFSGKRSPCSAAWSAFSCQRTSAAIDKAHVAATKIQKTISTYCHARGPLMHWRIILTSI